MAGILSHSNRLVEASLPVKTQTGKKKLDDEPKLRPASSTEQVQFAFQFSKNSIIRHIEKWWRDSKLFLKDRQTTQRTPKIVIPS
mmetsp:Transcript_22897/g.29326  ORF Transcript_22897/g.29326 Transcript_22897/m.29326 type:complete len:85 (+) Transcript_22897:653-907(+)